MIQLLRDGRFRNTSVTINRFIAGTAAPGNGFPITESLLQGFGNFAPITEEFLASLSDTGFSDRVNAFKVFLKAKYNFVTDQMLDLVFQGTDTVNCVPESISSQSEIEINEDTNLIIYFDNTGSMGDTYTRLDTMRRTLFKNRLIGFYNNNDALYESKVRLINFTSERAFTAMNHMGLTLTGNTLVLLFQNEAHSIYHNVPFNSVAKDAMKTDLALLKARIDNSLTNAWKAVSFHVHGPGGWRTTSDAYKAMMQAVENGNNGFSAADSNLTNYPQVKYVYDLLDGQTPEYYLDSIITTMRSMGYRI